MRRAARVKDVNFDRGELTIRDGEGGKDRVTMLPAALTRTLLDHLRAVKTQHESDLLDVPRAAAFVCDEPARSRLRHPDDPGTARSSRRQHDDDSDARPEPGRARCAKSAGSDRRRGVAAMSCLRDDTRGIRGAMPIGLLCCLAALDWRQPIVRD